MKCYFAHPQRSGSRGLTLAEVLVAMSFIAIVLPVTVHAILTARQSGVEADREREAARLADRLLSEFIVTGDWERGDQSGEFTAEEISLGEAQVWSWEMAVEEWNEESLSLITVTVFYQSQGRERSVTLSTVGEITE